MSYWTEENTRNSVLEISFFFVVPILVNVLNVRKYGELEYWLTAFKVISIVGIILVAFVVVAGGAPSLRLGTDATFRAVDCAANEIGQCLPPPGFDCTHSCRRLWLMCKIGVFLSNQMALRKNGQDDLLLFGTVALLRYIVSLATRLSLCCVSKQNSSAKICQKPSVELRTELFRIMYWPFSPLASVSPARILCWHYPHPMTLSGTIPAVLLLWRNEREYQHCRISSMSS